MVADGLEIWARIDEAMLTDLVSPDPRQLLLLAVEGGTSWRWEAPTTYLRNSVILPIGEYE